MSPNLSRAETSPSVTHSGGITAGRDGCDTFPEHAAETASVTGDRFPEFDGLNAGAQGTTKGPEPTSVTPPWIRRHLEATGRANTDGISRAVRARTCPRCAATILAALDDDVAALPTRVDPGPIDAAGELAAILTGRATYRIHWRTTRHELDHRDRWQIRGEPPATADRRGQPIEVLAEHRCGLPLATGWPTTGPTVRTTTTTGVPF